MCLARIFLEKILYFTLPDIRKTQAKGRRVVFLSREMPYFSFTTNCVPVVMKRLRAKSKHKSQT